MPQLREKKFNQDGLTDLPVDDLLATSCFLEVHEGECRWPVGGAGDCCGRTAQPRSPYCETHHKRAYHKPPNWSPSGRETLHASGVRILKKVSSNGCRLAASHLAEDLGL